MLAGVTLREAVAAVGHRKGTTGAVILAAARKLGLWQKNSLWQIGNYDPLPVGISGSLAIVHVRRKRRKNGHWCCIVDGIWHDPFQPTHSMYGTNDIVVKWMTFARK